MKKLSVDAAPLSQFRASQEQNPGSYLHLVGEYWDFSERPQTRDAYWVEFQFDSGLVSDTIAETIEVSIFLGGSSETDSGGIGSLEPFVYPNELNILRGRRTQLATQQIPIKGEALNAEIVKARSEGRTTARLEVRVFLKGYQPFILKTRNMAVAIRRAEACWRHY